MVLESQLPFHIAMGFIIVFLTISLHKIDEGNVGVYYRAGALLTVLGNPGVHLMFPFLTKVQMVQVRFCYCFFSSIFEVMEFNKNLKLI